MYYLTSLGHGLVGLRESLFVCLWILMAPAVAPFMLAASTMTTANHRFIIVDLFCLFVFWLLIVEHFIHLYIIYHTMCFHRAFTGWSCRRVTMMMRRMRRTMTLVYVDFYSPSGCKSKILRLTDLEISWMVI